MTASPVLGSALSLRLVRGHFGRATLIWIAAHVFLALASGELLPLGIKGCVVAALTASAVAFVDARRRRELGFLGNLGVPSTVPMGVAAVTVVGLEALLTTFLRI
jgi:hypothetical protein